MFDPTMMPGGMPPPMPMMEEQAGLTPLAQPFAPPSPPEPELPRLKISAEKKQELTLWICESLRQAKTDGGRQQLMNKLAQWNRNYEGLTAPKTFPWKNAANVWVPLTARSVRGVAVRLSRALLMAEPMVLARPLDQDSPDIVEVAKKKERWMQGKLLSLLKVHDPDEIGRGLVFKGVKDGTAISQLSWRSQTIRRTKYESSEDDILLVEENKQEFGPELESVPLEDFEILPCNATSLDKAYGVMRRQWLRWDDLKRGEKAGMYENIDLVKTPSTPTMDSSPVRVQSEQNEGISPDGMTSTNRKAGDEYEVYEGRWRFDVDDDGIEETLLVTIALQDEALLRVDYWPYEGKIWQEWRIIPRPDRFYGQSIPDMVESLQAETNAIHNQRLDSITIRLAPILKARKGAIVGDGNPRNIAFYPGMLLWLSDMDDIDLLNMGEVNPAAFTEETMLVKYVEDITGITDMKLGRPSSGRRTWGEISQVMMESNAVLEEMVSVMGATIPALAYQVESLFRQYAPEEMQDFDVPVEWLPNGSLAAANRSMVLQNMMQLFAILSQSPLVTQDPSGQRLWAITRDLLNAFDIKNPQDYIGGKPQPQQQPQQQQLPPGLEGMMGGMDGGQQPGLLQEAQQFQQRGNLLDSLGGLGDEGMG